MKALSPADQLFLWLERRNQPMHVGGLLLMRPPKGEPDFLQEMEARVRQAVQAQPPFNQRLVGRFGFWFWREDHEFDLDAHLVHISLPKPGRIRELLSLVSKLHGNLMDRAKPLWEVYIIDGIEDGRVAMYVKIHHALVDGVACMRMLQKAMSEDPNARDVQPFWMMKTKRRSVDSAPAGLGGLLANISGAVGEQLATVPTVARELMRSIQSRRRDPDHVTISQAPKTIFNQRISASRRFAAQSWSLPRMKAVAEKHGVTLNDVVLAMCGGALRNYLKEMQELPEKPLIAMVPVSLRKDDSIEGNQIALLLANLGTHVADPVKRLQVVAGSVKSSKDRFNNMSQTEIMNYVATVMGANGLNMLTGLVPSWQAFNVVISNVPGPKSTLYFNGAEVEGVYPVSLLLDGQAMNITLNSYANKLEFGVLACRRTVPHMQRLLTDLETALSDMEQAPAEAVE